MANIAKCPHCGKPIIIEPALKIDVNIAKLDLEAKPNGNGNEPLDKKSSGNKHSGG